MRKHFIILVVLLSVPHFIGSQPDPSTLMDNQEKPGFISDQQRIGLIQKMLFLISPAETKKREEYLTRIFSVPTEVKERFFQNYDSLSALEYSFMNLKDPFTGLAFEQLDQCYGAATFSDDVTRFMKTIADSQLPALKETVYREGVSFLFSDVRREQLTNDIDKLNDIIDQQQKNTVGGEHNRWALICWELVPYLDQLKAAVTSEDSTDYCLFYRHYVKARVNTELIKLLTSAYTKYDWKSIGLGQYEERIGNLVKEYLNAQKEFRRFNGKISKNTRAVLRKYFEAKQNLINALGKSAIEQVLISLIGKSELTSKILSIKNVIDNAQALREAYSKYKPYQDPTGTHLDLFYNENHKVWLRAKLSESIVRPVRKDTSYTRSAGISLIIRKGDVPVLTQQDFARVGNNLKSLQSSNALDLERMESVVEIPLGVSVLDLSISPSGPVSNARIFYPDSLVYFNVAFKSNPVWGAFKNDIGKQEELLRHLGIPYSNGFKLTGIIPHINPEEFRFRFEITPPAIFDGLLDSSRHYDLSVKEMQQEFAGTTESMGEHVKVALQQKIQQQLKVLLDQNKEELQETLSVFPFLGQLDNIYLKTDDLTSGSMSVKGSTIQIEKGKMLPFEYHIDFALDKEDWPELLEYPENGSFGFKVRTSSSNGHLSQKFSVKTKLRANSGYLGKVKQEVIDLAKGYGIYPDSSENKLLINIFSSPVEIDLARQQVNADIIYDNVRIGHFYYRNGKLGHELDLSKELIKKILQDKAQVALNKIESMAQSEFCDWLKKEKFFIGSLPGWQEVPVNCDLINNRFKKEWKKQGESGGGFAIEGKFDENGLPKITKVNYDYLTNHLNKYVRSFKDTLNNFRYVKFGNGKFSSEGQFEVPLYINLDFLEADTLSPVGHIQISRNGQVRFDGNEFNITVIRSIQRKIKKHLNEVYFSQPYTFNILDQKVQIDSCSLVDIDVEKITFRATAEVFGQIKVFFDVIYNKGYVSFKPVDLEISELEQMISVDLGIANVSATANISLSPLGIKGIANLEVFGLSFPPMQYLLSENGLEYKLATAILIPGVYPIAPGVVIIDPRITLDVDEKKVRASTVVTVGGSEEARATSRLIKLNTFLTFPYEWGEDITYGGDLVALTVLPLMKGRGVINPKEAYFQHRTETNKAFSDLIDYQSFVEFNGKARLFTGNAYLKLLDEIRADLSLTASVPSGRAYVYLDGSGAASLVFADFSVTGKTKMIPGVLASTSALLNAEMGFNMSTGKKLLGVEISSVTGEASIEQARFNVGLLGAEFGITVPGPNDLDEDMILDLIKMMFDFKIDVEGLLNTPDVNDLLSFNPSVNFSSAKVSLGFKDANTGGGGKKISGNKSNDQGVTEVHKPVGNRSNDRTGNIIEGNISHPYEKVGKREKKSTSCPWYKPFTDCYKWVTVYYDKFKPQTWSQVFSNLPKGFKEGSMIFSDESHPKTGNEIKSLIAPISVNNNKTVHKERSKYDLLLTDIPVSQLYRNDGQYSFCENCNDSNLSVAYDKDLDVEGKFSINLGFEKASDNVVVFTSYNLFKRGNSVLSGTVLPDDLDSLVYYKSRNRDLECKNCIIVTDSIPKKQSLFLEGNRQFFKKENELFGSKYVNLTTDEDLRNLYSGDSQDSVKIDIKDYLRKLDANYEYLAVTKNQIIAFESIKNLVYYKSQSTQEDNKLYELTGKVWVKIDEQIFLNQLLKAGAGSPDENQSTRDWLLSSMNDDDGFTSLFEKVLNEIIKTNGNLEQNLIEIAEFDAQLLVIEKNPPPALKWTTDGTKTFIVVNPGSNKLLKKGEKFDFNLTKNFGSYFDDYRNHFNSLESLKKYFESDEKPLLRNFVVSALVMGDELFKYYGVHLGKSNMLLARFDKSNEEYSMYNFLKISHGQLSDEIVKPDSIARLRILGDYLKSEDYNSYTPVFPFNNDVNHWGSFFTDFDADKGYWVAKVAPKGQVVTSLRLAENSNLYYYWFNHSTPTGVSSISTGAYNDNYDSLKSFIFLRQRDKQKALDQIFPLINKSIERSNRWYDNNLSVSPFSLMRDVGN